MGNPYFPIKNQPFQPVTDEFPGGESDIFVRAGTNISISQELYQELCAQRRWTFACPFCWISRLVKCDSRAYQSVPSWLARLAHRKSLENIWIWDDIRVRLCYLPKKDVFRFSILQWGMSTHLGADFNSL